MCHRAHHTRRPRAAAADALAHDADQQRSRGGDQKTVEPIHQAAMTWDKLARVLGAEMPLDSGFKQIAGLRQATESTNAITPTDGQPADPIRIGDQRFRRQPPRRDRRRRPTRSCSGSRCGHNRGPPIARPAEIGGGVGRPDGQRTGRETPQSRIRRSRRSSAGPRNAAPA